MPLGDDPRIAKNPFNVYGCWCKTTIPIEESAEVAAGTVAHRLLCVPVETRLEPGGLDQLVRKPLREEGGRVRRGPPLGHRASR